MIRPRILVPALRIHSDGAIGLNKPAAKALHSDYVDIRVMPDGSLELRPVREDFKRVKISAGRFISLPRSHGLQSGKLMKGTPTRDGAILFKEVAEDAHRQT
jgi:hypothetical protein